MVLRPSCVATRLKRRKSVVCRTLFLLSVRPSKAFCRTGGRTTHEDRTHVAIKVRERNLPGGADVEMTNRPAWLDGECAQDAGLRRQVEALLKVHDEPDSLLDSPRIDVGISETPSDFPAFDHPAPEQLGTKIGPYKLREQIGEGGMGIVYAAEQIEPVRRKVALKLIKPGMDSREVIARFESERQALAVMEHPNIARILDAGVTEVGRSYFVMELVRGIPITEYCDEVRMSPRERLALFSESVTPSNMPTRRASSIAISNPPNVLVTQVDGGKPVVKVIDFAWPRPPARS